MYKLAATLFLTVALVMGFNAASSSQGFEAGKTLYYKGETGTNSRIEIKITPDGKSYKATIYSGKFKYKCSSAPLLPGGILDISECGDIDPWDPNRDSEPNTTTGSYTLNVEGSLDLVVGGYDGGIGRGTMIEFTPDRHRLLHSPSIADPLKSNIPNTKAKTQISKTSAGPLSQKLVTLKTLLKGGLITQKDYNTKRAAILKEMSGGKVDPIIQKLKRLKKLLDQKLISPATYEYKSRKILDGM